MSCRVSGRCRHEVSPAKTRLGEERERVQHGDDAQHLERGAGSAVVRRWRGGHLRDGVGVSGHGGSLCAAVDRGPTLWPGDRPEHQAGHRSRCGKPPPLAVFRLPRRTPTADTVAMRPVSLALAVAGGAASAAAVAMELAAGDLSGAGCGAAEGPVRSTRSGSSRRSAAGHPMSMVARVGTAFAIEGCRGRQRLRRSAVGRSRGWSRWGRPGQESARWWPPSG
jgi:hypothetical protein